MYSSVNNSEFRKEVVFKHKTTAKYLLVLVYPNVGLRCACIDFFFFLS